MPDPKYDLDGVSNVPDMPTTSGLAGAYPTGKGNVDMDGIESVKTDAALTHDDDWAWPQGKPVDLNAVTDVEGMAKNADMVDGTGTFEKWPRAWSPRGK